MPSRLVKTNSGYVVWGSKWGGPVKVPESKVTGLGLHGKFKLFTSTVEITDLPPHRPESHPSRHGQLMASANDPAPYLGYGDLQHPPNPSRTSGEARATKKSGSALGKTTARTSASAATRALNVAAVGTGSSVVTFIGGPPQSAMVGDQVAAR